MCADGEPAATVPAGAPAEQPGPAGLPGRRGWLASHQRAALAVGVIAVLGFLYYVVPQIVGLGPTLRRLRTGDLRWLALGIPFEALSIAGYIWLFRGVFSGPEGRIGWSVSYQITMAGTVATKLLAAAGSGGVALTVWALRASGLSPANVARRMVAFEIVNYAVYMAALLIAGLGLWVGVFAGRAPFGLTALPALFGGGVIVLVLSMRLVAGPTERLLRRRAERSHGRARALWRFTAGFPRALQGGLRNVLDLVRSGDSAWLGALPAWGFDIAVLWASFRAFGHSPPGAVLVLGYYVGTLGDILPVPGGIGAVEGGMIGAFLGFGVNGSLAVLAVLAYRTISYWLPTLPGAFAYLHLRHTVGNWRADAAGQAAAGGVDGAPGSQLEG